MVRSWVSSSYSRSWAYSANSWVSLPNATCLAGRRPALRAALLVVVVERGGAGALLGIAVDLDPCIVGADERRQVPGTVGLLGDVVAQARAERPQVAVGVAFLAALAAAQGELALQVVVVEVAAGQRRVGPPAVFLVLHEGAGYVAVHPVVGILGAGFQLLPVETGGDPGAPGLVDAVAAAKGQVVAIAVAAGGAVLGVEVQALATAADEAAPLADVLPVLQSACHWLRSSSW